MKKNTMYFDTNLARINKDIYRPSSNLVRFFKSLMAVILMGQSPLSSNSNYTKKRYH